MTHNTRKTGIFTLALGLAMCLTLIFGIISVNPKSVRADTTTIDTLEVAFGKVNAGDSLAAAFENSRMKRKERSKFLPAQIIPQRSRLYPKTGKRQRCGEKTARRFRGAELKINLSSRKLPTASASILSRKKTINCPKKQTCLKEI